MTPLYSHLHSILYNLFLAVVDLERLEVGAVVQDVVVEFESIILEFYYFQL